MPEEALVDVLKENLLREFTGGIAKLRYELAKNLAETNILKADKRENVISVFNQRLSVFQHDFLQLIAQAKGHAPNRTENLELHSGNNTFIPAFVGGLAGAYGGAVAGGTVVTTVTSGWWLWASTQSITLASWIAAAIGVSVDVASGGLTLGCGVIGAIVFNKILSGIMKKRIRKRILREFDENICLRLNGWANGFLHE